MTAARFRAILAAAVLVLAALTLVAIAGGDRTEPAPLSVQPADGDQTVSAASSLVLRFGRPVDREAVAAALRIDPPAPGVLEVDRSVVRYVPTGQLRPLTRYTVTLRAGFQDQTGRVLRADRRFSFQTRPARLVFSRPESGASDLLAPRNLWVTELDGSAARPLTREPLGILFAAVGPDGERVIYSAPESADPNASALWTVGLDGAGRQKLAGDLDGAILSLAWSPRGDQIAYERRSVVGARGELGRPRILAVRPDGGGGGLLYGRGEEAGALPAWSPDGRRLAVYEPARGGRAIVDLAGESVPVPGGGADSGTWSPDGQHLAFADLVEDPETTRSVIRVVDRRGQPVADLSRLGFSDTAPNWSPSGRHIAVVGRHDDGVAAIWLLDPQAGAPAMEVPGSRFVEGQLTPPVWSPGGELLAFSRVTTRAGAASAAPGTPALDWELWVARGDGTELRRLPEDGLAEGWAP